MGTRPLRRTLLLVLLFCAVAAGAFALRSANARTALIDDFDARVGLLLERGRYDEAKALLDRANQIDPEDAWLRILQFRTLVGRSRGGFSRELVAKAWPALVAEAVAELEKQPTRAKPLPEPADPLAPLSDGSPDAWYLKATRDNTQYDSLFEEYSALLGRPSVATVDELPEVEPGQWLVVSASYPRSVPEHSGHTLFLGPTAPARKTVGVVGAERRDVGKEGRRCSFVSEVSSLHAAPTEPLSVPFAVPFEAVLLPEGATTLATIRCGDDEHPALVRSRDGRTLMFTFDFGAWIVRLRQGDITLKDRETDDVLGIRPSDMFVEHRTIQQLQVPHTDLVFEGLWRVLEERPFSVRLWHHPSGARSTFIVTSDQDGADTPKVDLMAKALGTLGVGPTMLLMPKSSPLFARAEQPDRAFVDRARAAGVDFGLHPDLLAVPNERRGSAIAQDKAVFAESFAFEPTVARNHWVAWWGWVEAAKRLEEAGYRYDLSYLTLCSKYLEGLGYMTGSGLPLRFYDERGTPLEIRQLATQLDDHANPIVPQPVLGDVQLTRSELYHVTERLFERSAQQFHSPLVVNNHPGQFAMDPHWLLTMVKAAQSTNVSVMNVTEYARFIDGLLASDVRRLAENRIAVLVQHPEQEVLLPADVATVTVDGNAIDLASVERYGRPVRSLRLPRGRHVLEVSP